MGRKRHVPRKKKEPTVLPAGEPATASGPTVEQEVIRRCQAGESRFFEPIVRSHEKKGLIVALGYLGNLHDAQEALQKAFVKCWNSLHRFDINKPFRPWFMRILCNQCKDELRRRRLDSVAFDDSQLRVVETSNMADPARRLERREAKRLLWKALARLSAKHREVLVLKELEGYKYREIAAMLGVPEGTVAARLFYAKRALQEELRPGTGEEKDESDE